MPEMQEMWVPFLSQDDSPGEGNGDSLQYSYILSKGLRRTARQVGCWAEIMAPRASLRITRGRPLATSDLFLQLLCKENDGLGKHVLAFALGPGAGCALGVGRPRLPGAQSLLGDSPT